MLSFLKAVAIRLGIGCAIVFIGILFALISHRWSTVSNVLGFLGLLSMCVPLLGGGGGWSGIGKGGINMNRGFRNHRELQREQRAALGFGITCMVVGLPSLITAILVYVFSGH
jgi:hypothetical protein